MPVSIYIYIYIRIYIYIPIYIYIYKEREREIYEVAAVLFCRAPEGAATVGGARLHVPAVAERRRRRRQAPDHALRREAVDDHKLPLGQRPRDQGGRLRPQPPRLATRGAGPDFPKTSQGRQDLALHGRAALGPRELQAEAVIQLEEEDLRVDLAAGEEDAAGEHRREASGPHDLLPRHAGRRGQRDPHLRPAAQVDEAADRPVRRAQGVGKGCAGRVLRVVQHEDTLAWAERRLGSLG